MAYFTDLNLYVLQDHASRWANEFPRLTRISLHQYHGQHEPPASYRYAIIFEIETEKVSYDESFDIQSYDYFYNDLFRKVYNYENIDPHYKNEWFFLPTSSNEKWPDFAPKEPCWQLFPIECPTDLNSCDQERSIATAVALPQAELAEQKSCSSLEIKQFFAAAGKKGGYSIHNIPQCIYSHSKKRNFWQ